MAGPGEPKFIVLDANAFVADYWLRSPSFVLLRKFLQDSQTILAVPLVVVDEVVNHYKEELEKAQSKLSHDFNQLRRLLLDRPATFDRRRLMKAVKEAESQRPYRDYLIGTLEQLRARIVEYKDIPHSDLVKRDLDRRRPFQDDGRGYRDALIWESVIRDCLEKGALTILITQNSRDFCGGGTDLHQDLKYDLTRRGFKVENLEVFHTLANFTDAYIVPYLMQNKQFAALVEAKKIKGLDLQAVCEENIDRLVGAINENPASMIGDPGQYEPHVDVVDTEGHVEVQEASEISSKLLLVIFEIYPYVSFIYYLPRDEYITMSDERSEEITVVDPDWNESVMEVEETTTVRVRCRLTFNTDSAEVESFEVDEVQAASGEY